LGVALKTTFFRILKWEYFWLCVIIVVTLAMHFAIINQVKTPILDEVYYYGTASGANSGDANSIINKHTDDRPEHPPLAKLIISGGIITLGDNPTGWRTPSIIFGTIGLVLFYFICRKLNMSKRAANIATFFLAFENFTFLMSSIAMLDVFFVTFILAFFLLYLYREYLLSGVFIGLAALAKLYAAIAAPALLIHWIFSKTRPTKWFILTVIAAPISFVALMPLFDFIIYHQFKNPLSRIQEMISLSGSLTFANTTHPALSRPWEWLLNYRPMAFWYTPHYTGAVSLSIWMLMIPVVLYMIYRAVKGNDAGLFGFAWFFSTFLLWIPMSIITDRISFIYYFYPSVGALCIGLGLGLNQALEWASTKTPRTRIVVIAVVGLFLVFHLANFIVLSPVFFSS
jgi:dolichyl-phosphate-mannose-protein mannosyltransferase